MLNTKGLLKRHNSLVLTPMGRNNGTSTRTRCYMCRMLSCMSDWANELVVVFAESMRRRRAELDLSAQKLEDRTASIGHKVTKAVIADLETGRRRRLYLPDALVIAEALNTSLATLLYPGMPDEYVEFSPVLHLPSLEAAHYLVRREAGGVTSTALAAQREKGEPLTDEEMRPHWRESITGNELISLSEQRRDLAERIAVLSEPANRTARSEVNRDNAIRRLGAVEARIVALGGVIDNGDEYEELENG